MILNQITLHNFCLYRGEQAFDLTPVRRGARHAPIVLFGGMNGGGKTTLLDAVQLVLYGPRARCSKRGDKGYEEFLKNCIHHGAEPGEGAAIQLAFRYAAEGTEHLYEVTRRWSEAGGRVRETVQVRRDGEVDHWLSSNWNQLVEELIPFGIAQLCFFDAEKIRFLAEDETSTEALGTAIKSLLGLDLVERLITDAGVLEGRLAKRARKSNDLADMERLEGELASKQAEIERLVQERGTLENPRLAAHERVLDAEEKFARTGGEHWQQREARQRQAAEVSHSLREGEQRLIALAAIETPLALVGGLLRKASQQATREVLAAETDVIAKLLSSRDARLLKLLKKKGSTSAVTLVEEFIEADQAERGGQPVVETRLHLSDSARRLMDHLLERGLDDRCREAKELLQRVEHDRRVLEDLQRSLAATPEERSIREVADELKLAAKEAAALDQQVVRLDKELERVRGERLELECMLSRLRRKVVDEEIRGEEDQRMAGLLTRTQTTMQEFLKRATASKIDRLSELITESFRFLLRKRSFVQRVLIDPVNFAITLLDSSGREIAKQRLSEGEKQIFAISVLWGLSRAAGRPLPGIIDTPMARLDSEHRQQLVERYFPHASHQVIILSTDTEIDLQYFQTLQPHIARAYHLNYDEQQKQTIASEGYFWEATAAEEALS